MYRLGLARLSHQSRNAIIVQKLTRKCLLVLPSSSLTSEIMQQRRYSDIKIINKFAYEKEDYTKKRIFVSFLHGFSG